MELGDSKTFNVSATTLSVTHMTLETVDNLNPSEVHKNINHTSPNLLHIRPLDSHIQLTNQHSLLGKSVFTISEILFKTKHDISEYTVNLISIFLVYLSVSLLVLNLVETFYQSH